MRVLRGQISLLFEAVHDNKQSEIITARAQVERLLSADSEFAGFSRAYARQEGIDRPEVGVTIPQ